MSFWRNAQCKQVTLSVICILTLLVGCEADKSGSLVNPSKTNTDELAAPIALKVGEGFENPIGYYEAQPRFSWEIAQDANTKFQTAYQIQVTSSKADFAATDPLWDSKKVTSDQTSWVKYSGKPLSSRQTLMWRVRIWDEQDKASTWSKPQSVELGLLDNQEWQAKWIGHPDTDLTKNPSQGTLATPQYLRKEFEIKGNIKKARLYITSKGLFKPYINGTEVSSEDVMTPGWTPYAKRIESLTYDVTNSLVEGNNTIAASIAGGWYAGRVYKFKDRDHKLPARLLAQLEITYEDGTRQTIATDDTWSASLMGPIRFASIYDGERYEQSLEMPGWTNIGFEQDGWHSAISETLNDNLLIAPKRHAPIRITEQMPVKDIVSVKDGAVIFDFGQNMVGVPRLNIPVVAGQEVKVRYAEALHKGDFYTDNYRSAESTNYYLPNETGVIEYQPTFTYHGYRYIEVSGFDAQKTPNKGWATAMIQHSDVDIHANFKSSHPKLNQLSENIVWGMRSNFFDIPLDCPQRDERLGWTGDAQVFVTPSMYMADVYGFWSAWLQSIREEQGADGKIPLYIPFVEWINFASSGWGDAVTIIPWELYMVTGDETILSDNFEMMKGWVNYHQKKSENLISNMTTFGDWLQPYPEILQEGDNGNRGNTDFSLIGTAYFARSVELTLKTAEALNKIEDVQALTELHGKIKDAFMHKFFDEQLNLKQENAIPTQTTYLLGLAYDLFPVEKRDIAVEKLIELIRDADSHLRTGFLGTPLLTQVLQEAGRSDVIYELLFKETYPSWFYSINNGATTTWERWNSYSIEDGFNPQGMNSLNHYAYGTVSRWFYEGILGITPATPGFKHIRIAPQFDSKLSHAEGSYITPQGEVKVDWTVKNDQLHLNVVVPKNSTAEIVLPQVDGKTLKLNGKHTPANKFTDLAPGHYQIKARIGL
ncbi:family 78 glycoside hydrolase catalytic domain [Aliiglaciecola sp. 3_MG-2023]|uniref:family 78 glycoside hydrolase catalytic domain n=1 Tax=Aliiglaciecola sp. 3_MG-2023 TaxID=3062644 RepID=UPI0026E36E53|nr:family 78 glycoside hydrolase catalytic domain [Aliiglaciecola sp. 3_MG-2023]MDO6693296.1 family 78 glycoside hydrolase catalytic domain [Aliiglaciecola sp. 3_MG-2023]